MKKIITLAAFYIAVVGTALAAAPAALDWEIGPIIRGKNYSLNMPLTPTPTKLGWTFDFPYSTGAQGHVHYVTFDPGSLAKATRIKVRYRVQAKPGTRFVPQEHPYVPGTVSLFFQRRGDNWSARGKYALYRWYAPAHTVREIVPGVQEITVQFNDPEWISVVGGMKARKHPDDFNAALKNANRIGLVFGSTAARGHGVYATAPARFQLLKFDIQ